MQPNIPERESEPIPEFSRAACTEAVFTFTQERVSPGTGFNYQELIITAKLRDSGCYLVLATDHWEIDETSKLFDVLRKCWAAAEALR